eukprot:3087053-Rhodomonas_salina.3
MREREGRGTSRRPISTKATCQRTRSERASTRKRGRGEEEEGKEEERKRGGEEERRRGREEERRRGGEEERRSTREEERKRGRKRGREEGERMSGACSVLRGGEEEHGRWAQRLDSTKPRECTRRVREEGWESVES